MFNSFFHEEWQDLAVENDGQIGKQADRQRMLLLPPKQEILEAVEVSSRA